MVGNWTQHAFIDPNDPANLYKNSITCVNINYNHRCWNDGYHISHHIRPNMHWTEHPKHFKNNLDQYAKNKAIVFNGLDFLQVFYFLMNKRYEKLSQHLVNIDHTFNSKDEAIRELKRRTQKIPI